MKAVEVNSVHPYHADVVWGLLKKPGTLIYTTQDHLQFNTTHFPEGEWVVGQEVKTVVYQVDKPDNPGVPYTFIFDEIDDSARIMRTREWGGVIKSWQHTYEVQEIGSEACHYGDQIKVTVKPWILTPYLCWMFIPQYYTQRHKRLDELLLATELAA